MSDRIELHEEELDQVNGGNITYTWNGTSGRIGINGDNKFILVNKEAFVKYYTEVHGKVSDGAILAYLIRNGYATKDPNLG